MKNISLLLLLFCFCLSFEGICENKKDEVKIQDHFVFISSHLYLEKIKKEECLNSECLLTEEINNQVKHLNDAFINTPMLAGSSFVIDHLNNKESIIITSNHVCEGVISYLSYKKTLSLNKNSILKDLTDSSKFSYINHDVIAENFNLTSAVTLFDFNGNTYNGIEVIKQSKSKDLCLIKTKNIIGKPVVIQDKNCEYGEEIINISASDGNYFPKAVPFYRGSYSGSFKNTKFGLVGKNEEIALYTLDIEQGSSGSAVFSKKTKRICGNINATMKKANLSIGITAKGIRSFIDKKE